mgnify:CR=1 FL=1
MSVIKKHRTLMCSFLRLRAICTLLIAVLLYPSQITQAQTQESVNLAQQMFVAYYGRPGDPGGLNYWAGQFDESSNLDAVLFAFGDSQEYRDGFGALSSEQLVNGLFLQMFNRDSDPGGLAFYVGRLESGEATLASIAKQIADGSVDNDLSTLDNKITVANGFSSRVEEENINYVGSDIPAAQDLISSVTSAADAITQGAAAVADWVQFKNSVSVSVPLTAEQLAESLTGLSLQSFFDESFAALLQRTPEAVIWQALSSIVTLESAGLDDISDDYLLNTVAMHQAVLDVLRTFDRDALSSSDQINYDVYEWYLKDKVNEGDFLYYEFVATYSIFGTQRDTQLLFTDIHPIESREDAEDYISRLNAVKTKLTQLSEHLVGQQALGVVEPKISMEVALADVQSIANGYVKSNPYYKNLLTKLLELDSVSEEERSDLLEDARTAVADSIIPGYSILADTLANLLPHAPAQIGVAQYPRGDEYYVQQLRHHTTTELTASQIHQLGLSELARVHAEMRVVFDELGYPQDETLFQLYERVGNDGGTILAADAYDTFKSIIDIAETRLSEAFDIFPKADVQVVADDYGGFYIAPSFDGTRPGSFYAGTRSDQSSYEMRTLTYHEAVPGHHLQNGIALDQDVPNFRKLIRFTAYGEGWALYAERLAFELGWYDGDPYGNLGRLKFEALRAARLVMDTGIHSMGWTFDQATQFNEENVGASERSSQGAAGRYSVSPGQATAYMVGMLQILEARQRAIDELGDDFELAEFHGILLTGGPMPMSILNTVVDQYIERKKDE